MRCLNLMRLVLFGDGGESDQLPAFQLLDMTNKIVLMQSLHDQDDAAPPLVV